MKKIYILFLSLLTTCTCINAYGQGKASDYFLPLCVGNYTILSSYATGNSGWASRYFSESFVKKEVVGENEYHVWQLIESWPCSESIRYMWLRESSDGSIMLKALSLASNERDGNCHNYVASSDINEAMVLPEEISFFNANSLVEGNLWTAPIGENSSISFETVSSNAGVGSYTGCVQIKETTRDNNDSLVEMKYYAKGIGHIYTERLFSAEEAHEDIMRTSFTTNCQTVVGDLKNEDVKDLTIPGNPLFYIKEMKADGEKKNYTATWVFTDGPETQEITQTYPYNTGGNFDVHIKLNCSGAEKSFVRRVYLPETSGTADIASDEVQVYPNPASSTLFIKGDGIERADVFSVEGKRVKSVSKPNGQIDVTALNAGLYYVKIQKGNVSKVQKITIK